ncbi:lipopolysaccharide biosynthesis protein [Clostridium sp. CAG:921]|mgnify:FL=1|nr:lipopolysaccharide biosynthesis protein [Clostridium sp. CAG:921]
MINLLLCGNEKVFDGALSQLVSIINRTKSAINCYIFTMDATRLNENFKPITDQQVKFLDKVVKRKNISSSVKKVDVTDIYNKEFMGSKNETAYCTPYTLLRLLSDLVFEDIENIEKLLYLDIDIMVGGDIAKLYDIDIEGYEYAAVKEKYGCWMIRPDYINAGMLLFNMKEIRKNKLLEKSRILIRKRKLLFADQDAIFWSTTKKKIIPRIYNEQSKFNKKDTIICHFCKRLMWFPYPHTENYKQWNIEQVHSVLKCHYFDKDLEEYVTLKNEFEESIKDVI